jgi:ribosomal protein S27AE
MPYVSRPDPCDNANHRRSNAPVSHCPQCGGVVNAGIRPGGCSEQEHAAARRRRSTFCVHCGTRLIAAH